MATAKTLYVLTTEEGTREEFTTIGALNKFTGTRVTKKDIEAGKHENIAIEEPVEEQDSLDLQEVADATDNVEIVMVGDAPKAPVVEPDTEELTNEDTDTTEEVDTEELTNEEDTEEVDEPTEDVEADYPEVGEFEDDKEISAYIKELSNEQLEDWANIEGVEFKKYDNPPIHRMRLAMAIKQLHFPKAVSTPAKKKKSKYGDYSTGDLAAMAIEHDVEVKDAKGDPRIERMYLIVALRNAGHIE